MLTSVEICIEYFNFSNIFFPYSVVELLEYIKINNYFINLLNDNQQPYKLIYSIGLVELKILKTYIKINLVGNFIKLSKFLTNTSILFM